VPIAQPPRVLITRPELQSLSLAQASKALGFSVSLLPCVDIQPLSIDPTALEQALEQHDKVLFTSANAVRCAHRIINLPWQTIDVHAIGDATARALAGFGQSLTIQPMAPFNSEAYLLQQQNKSPGSLLIIKGLGGRDLVQSRLQELNWKVSTLDVYVRQLPVLQPRKLVELFDDTPPDVACISSDEILLNLLTLCEQHTERLQKMDLIVNSQRCAKLAVNKGFTGQVRVADPPGDNGQLSCLERWQQERVTLVTR